MIIESVFDTIILAIFCKIYIKKLSKILEIFAFITAIALVENYLERNGNYYRS